MFHLKNGVEFNLLRMERGKGRLGSVEVRNGEQRGYGNGYAKMKWVFKETKQNWIFVLKSFKITRIEGWNGVGKDRKGLPFHLEDKLILFVLKFQCDKKHIANSESAVCQRLSLSHHSVL